MAEIPVERKKGGLPWWLIPLLLLLLLLPLLFFLSRGCNDRTTVVGNTNGNVNRAAVTTTTNTNVVANTGVTANTNAPRIDVQNAGTATGPKVTDVGFFGGVNDKSTLVGRGADLKNVKVNRVLSDRVFTVTSGSSEMFMLLDDKLNVGNMEERIKIRPGQVVNLSGDFRSVPTGEVKDEEQNRDLNRAEYARMKDQKVYLHVNAVSDAK